jgi:hypothetical protein
MDESYWNASRVMMWGGIVIGLIACYFYVTMNGELIQAGEDPIYYPGTR